MRSRIVLASLLLLTAVVPASALRFYVNGNPGGNGDDRRSNQSAQNRATPFRTIGHALRVAALEQHSRPHTISIAAGTYSATTNGEPLPVELTQTDVSLVPEGRVILDGGGRNRLLRIRVHTGEFVVSGLEFANGQADSGGAITIDSATVRISGNRFTGNVATAAGHVLYSHAGHVRFFNNLVRACGASGSLAGLVELNDSLAVTSQRDEVRNNTFYRNWAPAVRTRSNRTDIQNNLLLDLCPTTFMAPEASEPPLIRYNMFWHPSVLLIGPGQDTITVVRTDRDTLTYAEQGLVLPSVITARPPTLAKVGQAHDFYIPVPGTRSLYQFRADAMPNRATLTDGRISWTPTVADTGKANIFNIEITDTTGVRSYLYYRLRVYTSASFPDTTANGEPTWAWETPDTARAFNLINRLVPSFSTAASAGGNFRGEPGFRNAEIGQWDLMPGSPALDSGNPMVALNDPPARYRLLASDADRGNLGHLGGPLLGAAPAPDTLYRQLAINTLPDSLVVQGQRFVYQALIDSALRDSVVEIRLVEGTAPPTMAAPGVFGRRATVTWTPTAADVGSYLVGVIVETANSGGGFHYFPLRVRAANLAPVFTSRPDTTVNERALFSYTPQVTDEDGDAFTISLQSGPSGMAYDAVARALTWTPTAANLGRTTVTLKAADSRGASSTQAFGLVVRNINDPPTITSAPDTTANEDGSWTYRVAATDPDPGDTVVVTLTEAPTGASLDSAATVRWSPTQVQVGRQAFTMAARDRAGLTTTQHFTVTVAAVNDPPAISSRADSTALEDHAWTYGVVATDVDGDSLRYELPGAPAGMRVDATGAITWTPAGTDAGQHTIRVRAIDPLGLYAEQVFALTVVAVNDPPQLVAATPPVDTPVAVIRGESVTLAATAADEEGDTLGYAWRRNGEPVTGTASSLVYTPAGTVGRLDTLVVRVTDGRDSLRVSWVVDSRRAPVAVAPPDTLRLGAVALGDTGRAELALGNTGDAELVIRDATASDSRFAVAAPLRIAAGRTGALAVTYVPFTRHARSAVLTLTTNDPERPQLAVPVSGSGVVPTQITLDLDTQAGDQALATATTAPGATIEVALYVRRAWDLLEARLVLAYDPERLTPTSPLVRSDEANLFDADGGTVQVTAASPTAGRLQLDVVASAPRTATGLLAIARFAVRPGLASTATAIRLAEATVRSRGLAQSDTLTVPAATEVTLAGPAQPSPDLDGDGEVGFADFFLFADHFGQVNPAYDMDGSGGPVDLADFFLFADHFGERISASASQRPAPGAAAGAVGSALRPAATAPAPETSAAASAAEAAGRAR
jgi:hypothetical protein